MSDAADAVHAYWFGRDVSEHAAKAKLWFGGGPEIDAEIRDRFGALVEQARAGKLDGWAAAPRSWIAWLVLVDQFSRNLYRDSAEAFACDPKALAWARDGIARGLYDQLGPFERLFAILPFEHAEDLEAQKTSCAMAIQLAMSDLAHFDEHENAIGWARKHLDVIARFGRFPHRNAVLGRVSTKDELDYLAFSTQANQWL